MYTTEREPTEDEQIVDRINYLRGGEGDSVTILCDNPDFNGQPERVVECCGDWTGWEDRRYGGDTLLGALNAAWLECMQWRTALQYGREKHIIISDDEYDGYIKSMKNPIRPTNYPEVQEVLEDIFYQLGLSPPKYPVPMCVPQPPEVEEDSNPYETLLSNPWRD